MTTPDRVLAFVVRNAKRSVPIMLTLAAAAVQGRASVIFSVNGGSAFSAFGGSSMVSTALSGAQMLNGVNGLSLSGAATFTAAAPGAGNGGVAECGTFCGEVNAFGQVSGTFISDSMVFGYIFNLSDSNGGALDWDLLVNINDSANSISGTTAAGGGTVNNSFLLTSLNSQPLPTGWNVMLTVAFHSGFAAGDTITLNIPADMSLDFAPTTAAPEPGTGWLLATAGVALACLRRRLLRR